MKLCDITNFYSRTSGGVKTYLVQKQKYISTLNGLYQHILIVPDETTHLEVNGNCKTFFIDGPSVPKQENYRYIKDLRRIHDVIVDERPDIIEIGSPYLVPWAVRSIAKKFNIPLVGFFHSNFPDTYVARHLEPYGKLISVPMKKLAWSYARMVYSWCDKVVASSSYSESHLHAAGIRHTVRIPLGVDIDTFNLSRRNRSLRDKFNIPDETTILFYVGRLTDEKNIKTLLKAFDVLEARWPDKFAMVMAGVGPSLGIVQERADKLKNFHYAGYFTQQEELANAYGSADIFVTTSPNETFGLSPLEALASGLPVVAVTGGAVSEILPKQLCRIIEDPYDHLAVAEGIYSVNEERSEKKVAEIVRHVAEEYSWQNCFSRILSLYDDILATRKKR